jgi:two-component system, LuxR family, response regulator FixJ
VSQDAEPIIYVVDDDEAVRDSLKILLESYGMTVQDFGSIADFRRGHAAGRKACVILDLHLPGTSGLDYLATRDCASPLPVIIITGRGDTAARERARQMGARAFLDKPVSEETLLAHIREAIGAA